MWLIEFKVSERQKTHFLRTEFLRAEFMILCQQTFSCWGPLPPEFLWKPCTSRLQQQTPEHTSLQIVSSMFLSSGSSKHKDGSKICRAFDRGNPERLCYFLWWLLIFCFDLLTQKMIFDRCNIWRVSLRETTCSCCSAGTTGHLKSEFAKFPSVSLFPKRCCIVTDRLSPVVICLPLSPFLLHFSLALSRTKPMNRAEVY